jgi:hypothetical protein
MDAIDNIDRVARKLIIEHGTSAERVARTRAMDAEEANREEAAIAWRAIAAAVRRLGGVFKPEIMINCERTGQHVLTGMLTDQAAWEKLRDDWRGAAFLCPACGTTHEWTKSDAFLEAFAE